MSIVSTQGSSDSTFSATVDFSTQQHNYNSYSDKKIKKNNKPDFDSKNSQV